MHPAKAHGHDAVLFCLKLVARPGFPVVLTLASLIPITNWAIHAAYALADVKVYARAGVTWSL